jgi:regulator of sigma E protease
MGGLIMAGQLLLGLSILIILHELGHFLAARAFGIRVEKFYLFFDAWGFKLVHFTYKGCEYGIGWLPLGGYVKISGMIDESMDTEQLAGPPQSWEFRSKPAWQRLIVMLGGITVNIILGIFIFWMLVLKSGETYIPNNKLVDGIAPGKIGKEIGLEAGDRVLAVNGQFLQRFDDLKSPKVLLGNAELTVVRHGEMKSVKIPDNILEKVSDEGIDEFVQPRCTFSIVDVVRGGNAEKAGIRGGDHVIAVGDKPVRFYDEFVGEIKANSSKEIVIKVTRGTDTLMLHPTVTANGTIGIQLTQEIPQEKIQYGLVQALPVGAQKAWDLFSDNAKGIGKVVSGKVKAGKAFTGPIGIATMFGSTVNWLKFWTLVGVLSMALALMNLLPIPALDGGHAVFLLIEMIKGEPLSDKFMERAQLVGFVILIALMVFVFGNDIIKHVLN